MNVRDFLAAVEVHAAAQGLTPIHLVEGVWHSAKQSFSLAFGEGAMFPAPEHPESFLVRGVPVVVDHDGDAPETDAAKAIADLALVPGPAVDPAAMHPGAPQARVMEGQPRPELDAQTAVEHFAGDDGVFTKPLPEDGRAPTPEVGDGGSSPVPDSPGAGDPLGEAVDDASTPEGGFVEMSRKADGEMPT